MKNERKTIPQANGWKWFVLKHGRTDDILWETSLVYMGSMDLPLYKETWIVDLYCTPHPVSYLKFCLWSSVTSCSLLGLPAVVANLSTYFACVYSYVNDLAVSRDLAASSKFFCRVKDQAKSCIAWKWLYKVIHIKHTMIVQVCMWIFWSLNFPVTYSTCCMLTLNLNILFTSKNIWNLQVLSLSSYWYRLIIL